MTVERRGQACPAHDVWLASDSRSGERLQPAQHGQSDVFRLRGGRSARSDGTARQFRLVGRSIYFVQDGACVSMPVAHDVRDPDRQCTDGSDPVAFLDDLGRHGDCFAVGSLATAAETHPTPLNR